MHFLSLKQDLDGEESSSVIKEFLSEEEIQKVIFDK